MTKAKTEKKLTQAQLLRLEAKRFGRLYSLLAMVCVGMLMSVFVYSIIALAVPHPSLIAFFVPLCALLAGYLLQSAFGALTKYERVADSAAFENPEKFFSVPHAIPALLLAGGCALGVMQLVQKIMQQRAAAGLDRFYDKWSTVPPTIGLVVGAGMALGVALWFVPFSRVVSVKTFIPLTMLFFVDFVFSFLTGVRSSVFLTFCFVIYLICGFLILNQAYMIKTFSVSKNVRVTSSARRYNFAVIGIVSVGLLAVGLVCMSMVVGLSVIAKSIVFFVLRKLFGGEDEFTEAKEIADKFSKFVFSGTLDAMDTSGGMAKMFFFIFFLICVGVILVFILRSRREAFAELKKFFIGLYRAIVDFFMNLFSGARMGPETFLISDYLDEEVQMDPASVREYAGAHAKRVRSYREYLSRLNAIDDPSGRLNYAYNTLVACWREGTYGISASDTPREIRDKVLYFSPSEEVEELTVVFETVKYSAEKPDAARMAHGLEIINKYIKRNCEK